MELDITTFFAEAAPKDYSASVAELGPSAGTDTWRAACDDAPEYAFVNHANRAEVVDYFAGFGAWERAQLEASSNVELTAMVIQAIAGDLREAGLTPASNTDDWCAYFVRENVSQRLYRSGDGRVLYTIGN